MTTWTRNVFSTMVNEIGWDDETSDLIVTWHNGRKSAYAGVPEDMALTLANAPSVGAMINAEIKPNYQHRYL